MQLYNLSLWTKWRVFKSYFCETENFSAHKLAHSFGNSSINSKAVKLLRSSRVRILINADRSCGSNHFQADFWLLPRHEREPDGQKRARARVCVCLPAMLQEKKARWLLMNLGRATTKASAPRSSPVHGFPCSRRGRWRVRTGEGGWGQPAHCGRSSAH